MDGPIFTLAACTQTLLDEIANPIFKRRDVAKTYALALRTHQAGHEQVDWKRVNDAIIARWSVHALNWIKEQAWSGKCFAPAPDSQE